MTYKNVTNIVIMVSIIIIVVISSTIKIDFTKGEEKRLFPGIIGDTVLKSNETGISFIRNITLYDNFVENIMQGYKATYYGKNGTMVIFAARVKDNITANKSVKDMVIRMGWNESMSFKDNGNKTSNSTNWTILKLRVDNPEVFVIRRNNRSIWHYVLSKSDKVYWVGFDNIDIDYQLDMLVEMYRTVDEYKKVI